MSLRLWIAADHHAAFRCGGWAWVRAEGTELAGQAGGARNTTAGRNLLEAVSAALAALPDGAVQICISDAGFARALAALPQIAASGWKDARGEPLADQGLWQAVAARLSQRPYSAAHAQPSPATPMAFAAAWADLARDKAKDRGPFASPIPRPNLAKVQGL